jgi:hypothetical protein
MIRGAVVHLLNEQPMLADLRSLPVSADASLVCTNLRGVDGKPVPFIDRSDSWFVIPLDQVRFVEVPAKALAAGEASAAAETADAIDSNGPGLEPEFDEELLRRIRDS